MAIRIRKVKNSRTASGFSYVALCAAESEVEEGDLYLDDGMHGALSDKFTDDFMSMGFIKRKILKKWDL